MGRTRILAFALEELDRLTTANGRILAELPGMRRAATDRLLQSNLLEQEAVNARVGLELDHVHGMLVHERRVREDTLVLEFCREARRSIAIEDPVVRDLHLARSAVCLDHWQMAVYIGLASVFRQLYQDDVADTIDRCVGLLQRADQHLEELRPTLTQLHHDERPHGHQTRSPESRGARHMLDGYASTGSRGR